MLQHASVTSLEHMLAELQSRVPILDQVHTAQLVPAVERAPIAEQCATLPEPLEKPLATSARKLTLREMHPNLKPRMRKLKAGAKNKRQVNRTKQQPWAKLGIGRTTWYTLTAKPSQLAAIAA